MVLTRTSVLSMSKSTTLMSAKDIARRREPDKRHFGQRPKRGPGSVGASAVMVASQSDGSEDLEPQLRRSLQQPLNEQLRRQDQPRWLRECVLLGQRHSVSRERRWQHNTRNLTALGALLAAALVLGAVWRV